MLHHARVTSLMSLMVHLDSQSQYYLLSRVSLVVPLLVWLIGLVSTSLGLVPVWG